MNGAATFNGALRAEAPAMGCGASAAAKTNTLKNHAEGSASPTEPRPDLQHALLREQRAEMAREAEEAAAEAAEAEEGGLNTQEVRELFAEIDGDGGGSLDKDDVRQLLVKLGMGVEQSAVDEVMATMDSDGDGDLTLSEFLGWWREAGGEMKQRMTELADAALAEEERERRQKEREAAAAAARLKAGERMKQLTNQLKHDVLREWLVSAKNKRKERHEMLVQKLKAKFGNNCVFMALQSWKDLVAQIKFLQQEELERVASTNLQRLIRGYSEHRYYIELRVAVIKIQCMFREGMTHAKMFHKHMVISKLQSIYRGRMYRRQLIHRKPGRGQCRKPLDQADLLAASAPAPRVVRGHRPDETRRVQAAKAGSYDADTKRARERQLEKEDEKRLEKTLSHEVSVVYAKEKVAELQAEKLSAKLLEHVLQLDARDFTGTPEEIHVEPRAALQWILDEVLCTAEHSRQLIEAGAIPRLIKLTSDGANSRLFSTFVRHKQPCFGVLLI